MLNKIKKFVMQKWINGPRQWLSIALNQSWHEKIIKNPTYREKCLDMHARLLKCRDEQECKDYLGIYRKYKADAWGGHKDWSPSYPTALVKDDDCDGYAVLESRMLEHLYGSNIRRYARAKRLAFYHPKCEAHVMGYIRHIHKHVIFDYQKIKHYSNESDMKKYYIRNYVKDKYKKDVKNLRIKDVIITEVPEVPYPKEILQEK